MIFEKLFINTLIMSLLIQVGYANHSILHPCNIVRNWQRIGFDGQLTDRQTHWQFLGKGYRAYSPVLHRFMAQDSMSPFAKGGVNGYAFANNNPVMQADPSGHFSVLSVLEGLMPHSTGGFAGWGVGSVVALGAGALTGGLSLGIWSFAGAALVGATSSAAGEYVGQGVDTHDWVPHASVLLTSAAVGAGLSIVGDWVGSRVFAKRSVAPEFAIAEDDNAFHITTRSKRITVPKLSMAEIGQVDVQFPEFTAANYQSNTISDNSIYRRGGMLAGWRSEDSLTWDSRIGEGSHPALRDLSPEDTRHIMQLTTRKAAYIQALSERHPEMMQAPIFADKTPSIVLGHAVEVKTYLANLYQEQYPLSAQGRDVWLQYNWV